MDMLCVYTDERRKDFTMNNYTIIQESQLKDLSKKQMLKMYNDAVEMIYHLQHRITELSEEYEMMAEAYEKVSDELYG
jgi:hypothetical protein